MKCPVCQDTDLLMTERQGVEIDYCPDCRGVWLDRGELDKIVERSNDRLAAVPPASQTPPREAGRDHHDKHNDHGDGERYGHDEHGGTSKKKKGGLFGDILGGLGG
jgi:uncharacterized protein